MERLTALQHVLALTTYRRRPTKLYYVATSPDGRSLYERNLKEGALAYLSKSERMGYDS